MSDEAQMFICGLACIAAFIFIMSMCKAAAKPTPAPPQREPEDLDESFAEQERRTR